MSEETNDTTHKTTIYLCKEVNRLNNVIAERDWTISQLKAENERLEKENEQYDEDLKNAILKYLPLKDENEKLRQIKNVRILAENFDLKLENERLNLLERERRDSAARALLGLRWKDLNDTE